jgi:type I restriction enzyme M protein
MNENRQPPFLKSAIADGLVKFISEGKAERIHYIAADHSERWADPEEKVRAEFWAELIYKYEYRPERIRFEVKIPRRTPNDLADLVIYGDKDEELKAPYFVFECKRADISDAEFAQSVEQACGNRANLAAPFCGAIAGLTRRFLRFDKFPPGERDKNILPDIAIRYGKAPDWRFYRNVPGNDLVACSARRTPCCNPQMSPDSVGRWTPQPHRSLRRVLQNNLRQTPRREEPGTQRRRAVYFPAPPRRNRR